MVTQQSQAILHACWCPAMSLGSRHLTPRCAPRGTQGTTRDGKHIPSPAESLQEDTEEFFRRSGMKDTLGTHGTQFVSDASSINPGCISYSKSICMSKLQSRQSWCTSVWLFFSASHTMVRLETTTGGLVQSPCTSRIPYNSLTQDCIQMDFEYLLGRRL